MEILGYFLIFLGIGIVFFTCSLVLVQKAKNKKAFEGFIRSRVGYPGLLLLATIGAILCAFGQNLLENY